MIFNELSYFLFFLFPAVFCFHRLSDRTRPWAVAGFGVAFFAYYGYLHFGGAWGALTLLILVVELLTSRLYRPGSRWCVFGIVQALLVLVFFKYLVFFGTAWNDASAWLNLPILHGIKKLVLPLGISFFAFEFIHFAVENYRGRIQNSTLREYAAFIFFFPTMVAGPIKRYHEFLEQIRGARLSRELLILGFTRILSGLAKKHVLADTFAQWSAHLNTSALDTAKPLWVFFWITAYGMRIYFDFSGYSDIAIGSANLFGIRVAENFRWPYFSRNVSEFWHRWHISLSTWFRDYVFLPLGGSRVSAVRRLFNLSAVFLLSGLWHGADYNFLMWGGYHCVLMAGYLGWKQISAGWGWQMPSGLSRGITFLLVSLSWGFFSMSLPRAVFAYGRILGLR